MDHYKIVLPEFLNDQGSLFGGNLLKWVDEFAYVTASLDFPGNRFVTIALDDVAFKNPIRPGELLRFPFELTRQGTTSINYAVKVYGEKHAPPEQVLFATTIAFVNVDANGNKLPIKVK